jgi:hypothetical protein
VLPQKLIKLKQTQPGYSACFVVSGVSRLNVSLEEATKCERSQSEARAAGCWVALVGWVVVVVVMAMGCGCGWLCFRCSWWPAKTQGLRFLSLVRFVACSSL